MPTYILRRILLMIPTLLGAVTLIFLAHAAAARGCGAVHAGAGESGEVNKVALQQIRQELGLDQPLIVQYGKWLWGAARLDFGNSYWTRQPVIEELKRRYPLTANLAVLSLLLGTLIAIPIGVLSAVRQDTLIDYAARVFVIAGLSMPNFWLSIAPHPGAGLLLSMAAAPGLCTVLGESLVEHAATGVSRLDHRLSPVGGWRAHDALEPAGGAARRFCTHGTRQRSARAGGGLQTCAQQCLAAGDHHHRCRIADVCSVVWWWSKRCLPFPALEDSWWMRLRTGIIPLFRHWSLCLRSLWWW